jgi:hypothetical protein
VTEDFVTRLGHALREAADREERRTAFGRGAAAVRSGVPRATPTAIAAIAALAFAIAAAVYLAAAMRPEPARPPQPGVVAKVTVARGLGEIVSGFDSAWIVDTHDHALLRMDPASRRVVARIPLRGELAIARGADALWVTEQADGDTSLVRVDPRANRAVARIPLRTPASRPFPAGAPVPIADVVWVISIRHALRIDARSGRVMGLATLAPPNAGVRSVTAVGGDLWVLRSDGRLSRFDGTTGERTSAFRSSFLDLPGVLGGPPGGSGDPLLAADGNRLARLDPATGRAIWTADVDHVGPATLAHGKLWITTLDRDRTGDLVTGINPSDGRVVSGTHVGEHDAVSLAHVGGEVWLAASSGQVVILRP